MARPVQHEHPAEPYLRDVEGLSEATCRAYAAVFRRVGTQDPRAWLLATVGQATPKRTVAVYRGAVAALLRWQHYADTGERMGGDEALLLGRSLVPTRLGRQGVDREAPSAAQYELYVAGAATLDEPYRTMLLLLPLTGLRIGEMCGLSREHLVVKDGRTVLHVTGKRNKAREVPLSRTAEVTLAAYLEAEQPAAPRLFWHPGPLGPREVTPRDANRAMERVRAGRPELADVVPHSMRHLFATAALRGQVDLRVVQSMLGHTSLHTTMRYLHPDASMRAGAVDRIAEVLSAYSAPPRTP